MNVLPVSQHDSLQSLFGQSGSSINTEQQELLLANYNLPGLRIDGRMSAVRRFFCLFVTFDMLFTSVFWIICVLKKMTWHLVNHEAWLSSGRYRRLSREGLGSTLAALKDSMKKLFKDYITDFNAILATYFDPRYKLTLYKNAADDTASRMNLNSITEELARVTKKRFTEVEAASSATPGNSTDMTKIDGQSIEEGLRKEVLNYTYSTSMFDLVVCSFIRFLVLLLFYAFIHIHHYWIVAWNGDRNSVSSSASYPFQVLLLLISFLLTWAEAWLIDFNVLPQEARAKNLIRALMSGGPGSVSGQQDRTSRLRDCISQHTVESVANFYSPLQSPYESEDEECEAQYPKLSQQDSVWQCLGVEAVLRAYDLLRSPGWNRHSQPTPTDFITVRTSAAGRNIYKISAPIQAPAELLFRDVVDEVEQMHVWNPAVLSVKKVQSLSRSADVVHQISADVPGGMVKSRDFVMVRHWRCIQGSSLDDWTTCWISGGLSITHPDVPVLSQYIRGENGPGCWAFCERSTSGGRMSECTFHWVLETDLKGWVPRAVVDKAISGVMAQQVNALRLRAAALLQQQMVHYPCLSDNDDVLLESTQDLVSSHQSTAAFGGEHSDFSDCVEKDDSLLC
ncbi:MENTAL domain [Trinorchestia longiramus]|nr:MENTAL domain [Trinorchestia longiramus]